MARCHLLEHAKDQDYNYQDIQKVYELVPLPFHQIYNIEYFLNMSQQDLNIRVVCRLRPLNKIEIGHGGECCVKYTDKTIQISVGGDENKYEFGFDRIFGTDTRQVTIYEEVAKPIIDVMSGFNGTVFAYGQTGGGKTWTMEGPNHDDLELKGLIPRMMEGLFEKVQSFDNSFQFTIKCSYIEIYNQKIIDLLDPSKNKLEVKEDKQRGIFIQDCTQIYVASVTEMRNTMSRGSQNRKIAFTGMNERSSRSHSLFIVQVGQKDTKKGSSKSAKLYFVDLAGSEKVSKTGVSGQQLQEAKNINKSLSCLGNVINALTSQKKEHVPYRDSKLTRILQESLGGNSRTTLIINCSICSYNDKQTLGTLRFGYRAKSIKNKPTVNEEKSAKELQILLEKANKTIQQMTEQLKGKGIVTTLSTNQTKLLANEERERYESRIAELMAEIDSRQEAQNNSLIVNDLESRIKQLLLENKLLEQKRIEEVQNWETQNRKYLETIETYFNRESNLEKLLTRLKTDLNFLLLNLKYDEKKQNTQNKTFSIIEIIVKDIEEYIEFIRNSRQKFVKTEAVQTNNSKQDSVGTKEIDIVNKFKSRLEVTLSEPNLHESKFQKNFEEISCIIKERLNEDSLSDSAKFMEESSTEFETLIDSLAKEAEEKSNKMIVIKEQKSVIDELKKQIKSLNIVIEQLNAKHESLINEFRVKEDKFEEAYRAKVEEVCCEVDTIRNRMKSQNDQIKKLEIEKSNFHKTEVELRNTIEKYKKVVEGDQDLAERYRLEQKSKEYAVERQKLFNELYQLRDQLDQLQISNKQKDQHIVSLKATMKQAYQMQATTTPTKPLYLGSPEKVQKDYQINILGVESKNVVKMIKGGKPQIIQQPKKASSALRSKLVAVKESKPSLGLVQSFKNLFA